MPRYRSSGRALKEVLDLLVAENANGRQIRAAKRLFGYADKKNAAKKPRKDKISVEDKEHHAIEETSQPPENQPQEEIEKEETSQPPENQPQEEIQNDDIPSSTQPQEEIEKEETSQPPENQQQEEVKNEEIPLTNDVEEPQQNEDVPLSPTDDKEIFSPKSDEWIPSPRGDPWNDDEGPEKEPVKIDDTKTAMLFLSKLKLVHRSLAVYSVKIMTDCLPLENARKRVEEVLKKVNPIVKPKKAIPKIDYIEAVLEEAQNAVKDYELCWINYRKPTLSSSTSSFVKLSTEEIVRDNKELSAAYDVLGLHYSVQDVGAVKARWARIVKEAHPDKQKQGETITNSHLTINDYVNAKNRIVQFLESSLC